MRVEIKDDLCVESRDLRKNVTVQVQIKDVICVKLRELGKENIISFKYNDKRFQFQMFAATTLICAYLTYVYFLLNCFHAYSIKNVIPGLVKTRHYTSKMVLLIIN
jgi:hypothetical protein